MQGRKKDKKNLAGGRSERNGGAEEGRRAHNPKNTESTKDEEN